MGRYDGSGKDRTRNYATVIYSDDCIDKLNELHIPCLISPWHDKDVNPTGELKKAHRHVLINFDSVKTRKQCQELIEKIGGELDQIEYYQHYLEHYLKLF